jgi:hypothetical protein
MLKEPIISFLVMHFNQVAIQHDQLSGFSCEWIVPEGNSYRRFLLQVRLC